MRTPQSTQHFNSGAGAATEVDNRAAVLRLANTRSRRNKRIVEALACDRDPVRIHTLAHHLILDGVRATLRECLVVAIRSDRVGVAGDHYLYEAVLFRRLYGLRHDRLRFRSQVRLVEVEE